MSGAGGTGPGARPSAGDVSGAAVLDGDPRAPGLRVRVQRVEGVALAAVRLSVPGGARVEPLPGLALVTGRALSEGTGRRDYRELADRLESRGMLLHTGGTFEAQGLSLDALAEDWEEALELAAEVLLEPTFPPDRCTWVARQTAAELESLGDQPDVRTAWAFLEQLYHPSRRSRPLQGDAASLAALTPADCAAFHRDCLGRGLTVVVTGEVDEAAVEARVADLFGGLAAASGAAPEEPPAAEGLAQRRVVVDLPPPDEDEPRQAHLYVGHRTLRRAHEDHDALALASVVLGAGSGLTGRIPERIREREGLAYSANAHAVAGAGWDPGRLVVYVGTSVDTVDQAERGVVEELERFVADGPTDEEIADARAYLLGRIPFRRETARQIADLVLAAEHYGLPLDRPGWQEERLGRLTREDVHGAVRRHLHPDRLWVAVGVPGEE